MLVVPIVQAVVAILRYPKAKIKPMPCYPVVTPESRYIFTRDWYLPETLCTSGKTIRYSKVLHSVPYRIGRPLPA